LLGLWTEPGPKKSSTVFDYFRAGKKGFGLGCHLSGILDGYRIGVLTKGDLNFAKSVSICPPENSTGVGLIIVALNDLEACGGPKKDQALFCLAYCSTSELPNGAARGFRSAAR
jgi:hypothetical protein